MNMNAMADIDNETHAYVKDVALPKYTELAHFRILSKIGQNDRGITYLAHDKKSDKQVVIKESLPFFCAFRDVNTLQVEAMGFDGAAQYYAQITKHFVRTAHALKRANHPNLVPVLEVFEAYGTAYYVMPYLNGQTLYHNAPAVVDEEWLKPILKHLLGALDHLHAKKLLHLNVAPSNILMHEEATPTLISYSITPPQKMEISITMRMAPGYIPIEQMSPDDKCGSWTDLYALGATCYRFITGERPPEALDRIVDATTFPPLSERAELHGRFSHHFLKCVDKAMALRAQHRWQSSQEWLSAMENPQFFTEEPAAPKRSKWAPWLLTTAVLGLSLGGFFYAAPFTAPSTPTAGTETVLSPHYDDNALAWAIMEGDTARAEHLLAAPGLDINQTNSAGYTPLCLAAAQGHAKLVSLMLSKPGININHANNKGETALHLAAKHNRAECLKLLLAVPGIDINKAATNGNTPLDTALEREHSACVELLRAARNKNDKGTADTSSEGNQSEFNKPKMNENLSPAIVCERQRAIA